ncbi:MAG: RNA methyltransferase, partial [Blastocatellia bacterium]|nr:RNA methyltransferase [Blastocatellia bacterium]
DMAHEIDAATRVGCSVFTVSEKVFKAVADTRSPQGIALIADRPEFESSRFATLRIDSGFVIYLHEINNPNNLGAVLRSAEAAGCEGVITSPGSADPFSPKALRASMGSAFRMPIWAGVRVDEAFELANSYKMVPTAIDLEGGLSYIEADLKRPRLLMFGSEAHGLPEEILIHRGLEMITIPMATPVESLNLAASAAVVMFEARRQIGSRN